MRVYEFIHIFKNCDWGLSLKLHSWLWIELGMLHLWFMSSLTKQENIHFSFSSFVIHDFCMFFPFFIKLWKSTCESYCMILWLVHLHFSWKIWTLFYKSCNNIFLLFIRDIASFSIQKWIFCLLNIGTDHIRKLVSLLYGIYSMFQINWISLSLP